MSNSSAVGNWPILAHGLPVADHCITWCKLRNRWQGTVLLNDTFSSPIRILCDFFCDCCGRKCLNLWELLLKVAMKVAAFLGFFVNTLWEKVKFSLFVCKIKQHLKYCGGFGKRDAAPFMPQGIVSRIVLLTLFLSSLFC